MIPFVAGSSMRARAMCPLQQRGGWELPQSHQCGRELGHGKGRGSWGGGRRHLKLGSCRTRAEWSLVWADIKPGSCPRCAAPWAGMRVGLDVR